ncbi:MAG TPA: V-type ATPase subunit [Coriobacteriia bacterium]
MARGDAIEYGFATGRVMVLRTRLLSRAAYERLLDAPTFEDQRRVLTETHFGRFLDGVHNASDVERAVDESLRDLYEDFLHRAGLPVAVVAYFEAPYDFSALKSALRTRVLGVTVASSAVKLGAVDLTAFESLEELPGALGTAARDALDAGAEAGAEGIDAIVDAALFRELARLARVSRIELLGKLVARQADAANAKVLLRCAVAGRSSADARAMLVPGGTWKAAAAAELIGDPTGLVEAIIAARVLSAPVPADLLDLERLDVIVDAATAALEREAARGPIGPEPVLGYVLQRRAEAITVRAVLVGRLAGLPREMVASRVRGMAS